MLHVLRTIPHRLATPSSTARSVQTRRTGMYGAYLAGSCCARRRSCAASPHWLHPSSDGLANPAGGRETNVAAAVATHAHDAGRHGKAYTDGGPRNARLDGFCSVPFRAFAFAMAWPAVLVCCPRCSLSCSMPAARLILVRPISRCPRGSSRIYAS